MVGGEDDQTLLTANPPLTRRTDRIAIQKSRTGFKNADAYQNNLMKQNTR